MQGDTRWNDSYTRHPFPFLLLEGSPKVTVYFPQYTKNLAWKPILKQDLASAVRSMHRARDVDQCPQAQPD